MNIKFVNLEIPKDKEHLLLNRFITTSLRGWFRDILQSFNISNRSKYYNLYSYEYRAKQLNEVAWTDSEGIQIIQNVIDSDTIRSL